MEITRYETITNREPFQTLSYEYLSEAIRNLEKAEDLKIRFILEGDEDIDADGMGKPVYRLHLFSD